MPGLNIGHPVPCAVCGAPVPYWERYPRQVCGECAARAVDDAGHPLRFLNETITGGFAAQACVDDAWQHLEGDEALCLVDGVPCRAREHRFGGIVVQRID